MRITTLQYRTRLEAENAEIVATLQRVNQNDKKLLVKKLRENTEEIAQLNDARAWIAEDDTEPRIRLDLTKRIMRT